MFSNSLQYYMSIVKKQLILISCYLDIVGTYKHSESSNYLLFKHCQTHKHLWALNLPGRSTQGNYLIIQSLGTA